MKLKILTSIVLTAGLTALLMWWLLGRTGDLTTTGDSLASTSSICTDYDSLAMSTLNCDLIHTMVDNYNKNQLYFIEKDSSFRSSTGDDASSIWFDLETLKKYLYHIERISRKKDPSLTTDKLGVRIYYATYPEEINPTRWPDLDPRINPGMREYGSLHTLIMIPTIERDGSARDFNPLDTATYAYGLAQLPSYGAFATTPIPSLSGTSTHSRDIGARNHGILTPPGLPIGLGFGM